MQKPLLEQAATECNGRGIEVKMEISEADANLKLARWERDSPNLIVQITIGGFTVLMSAAKLVPGLADRIMLRLPTGTIMIPLSGATFESKTVAQDSLTINLSKGGSCFLQ